MHWFPVDVLCTENFATDNSLPTISQDGDDMSESEQQQAKVHESNLTDSVMATEDESVKMVNGGKTFPDNELQICVEPSVDDNISENKSKNSCDKRKRGRKPPEVCFRVSENLLLVSSI